MDQILEFTGNHPVLVGAFFATLTALVYNILFDKVGRNAVDAMGATALINHDDAVVVDVRAAADYQKGHIINAINIPLTGLKKQLQILDKHKDKPIVLACRSGNTSGTACKMLQKEGFERVHNLRGGMMAWQNANLPVSKK